MLELATLQENWKIHSRDNDKKQKDGGVKRSDIRVNQTEIKEFYPRNAES